jgi:hypothetical protein
VNSLTYALGRWILAGMVFVAVPVLTILSVNMVAGTDNPVTVLNWLATFWLILILRGGVSIRRETED